jgi:signal peptidase I
MEPTLHAGELVVGWRWFKPRAGDIVVARLPERLVIKRVIRIAPEGAWLEGDNAAASTDSRQFGYAAVRQLEAKVIHKL